MRKNQIVAIPIALSIIATVVAVLWAIVFLGIVKWVALTTLGLLAFVFIFGPIWDGVTIWLDKRDMRNEEM